MFPQIDQRTLDDRLRKAIQAVRNHASVCNDGLSAEMRLVANAAESTLPREHQTNRRTHMEGIR